LDRVAQINRGRLLWALAALLLLNGVHVLLFSAGGWPSDPRLARWAGGIALTHGLMGVTALGLLGLFWFGYRLPPRLFSGAVAAAGVATFAFAIALAAIDQAATPNVTPFLLASLAIGMLILQPPRQALGIYAAAGLAFWLAMGEVQPDAALRLSNQVNGLSICAMGWILSLLFWRHFVQHEGLLAELRSREALLQAQQQRLQELAVRDGLTQVWNRIELRRRAERELALAQRHLQDTSVILLDLDRFKHINDGWGHPAGDRVLVAVAGVLRRSLRASDEVGRLGGEEFVILLPQTDLAAAAQLAERLRGELARLTCPPVELPISASFGVASLPGWLKLPVAEGYERLYTAADAALYSAKQRGRNRVERAPELPLP
jgi:diguanylate cyclase (GGDEF)-like protein